MSLKNTTTECGLSQRKLCKKEVHACVNHQAGGDSQFLGNERRSGAVDKA